VLFSTRHFVLFSTRFARVLAGAECLVARLRAGHPVDRFTELPEETTATREGGRLCCWGGVPSPLFAVNITF